MNGSHVEDWRGQAVSHRNERPKVEETGRAGLTPRAFLIGLVLCIFLGLALPYNQMVIRGSFMNLHFLDRGALFLFFWLILLVNPLLACLQRRYALSRGELLSIYGMFLLLLSVSGMIKSLISYLTGVIYYASPERRDLEAVLPYILPWLAPQDTEVVRGLYEGLPDETPLPWGAWIVPLASWGAFLVVLCGVLICLAMILRKQWEEHERFTFPLMQVPLEMGAAGQGRVGALFKSYLMWAGFAIPFLIGTLRALHNYYYFFPAISLGTVLWIFRRTTPLPLQISFALFGYSYFMELDVSLSIYLFNGVARVIKGMLSVVGVEHAWGVSGVVGRFSSQGSEFLAFMGMGYMLALAFYSVWVGRGHFREVWARALGRPSRADDSGEVISYRTALLGVAGGLLYMGCWLHQGGMSPSVILLLFFICFVVFLVMARIVSETGFAVAYSPVDPPSDFVVCAVGSSAFSPVGLVTLGFSYGWTMIRVNTVMPHALGALRLVGEIRQKRGLFWAMGVSVAVGLIATSYMTLKLGYTHGGLNLDRHFHDYARLPFDEFVGRRMLEPSPIFFRGFLYTGLGAGLTALLIVLRTRFVGWPLHPVALPLSTLWWTDMYFFSVFLAWGIKAVALKFGGATLYRTIRPFFLGIILGEAVCTGVWVVVDYFTGMVGNDISW